MSRPDPHIIGLCPSTSYLLQMYIKSRMNKRPEKKTTVFTKKICKFKTSYYLCNTKFQRWIHLRVRIRASHARHRGSNPLSTTKLTAARKCGRFFVSDHRGLPGCFNPCRLFLRSVPLCAPILFVIEKGLLVMIVPGFVELICRRRASPLFLLQNCK